MSVRGTVMRLWGLWALALMFAAFYGANAVWAQDENSMTQTWPQQTVFVTASDGATQVALRDLAYLYNICPETLYEANSTLFKADHRFVASEPIAPQAWLLHAEANTSIVIPAHEACYDTLLFDSEQYNTILDLEPMRDMCWEEFIDSLEPIYSNDYSSILTWQIVVPRFAPPCYNDQNQRLTYYSDVGEPLLTPHYTTRQWVRLTGELFGDPYCRVDLIRVNPSLRGNQNYFRPGITLFIDDTVRLCDTVKLSLTPSAKRSGWPWIDSVSFEQNVCFDTLIAANGPGFAMTGRRFDMTADVPLDHPPCYDQYRRRLGWQDRRVYFPRRGEKFKQVAAKHNVCVQDLLANNPHVSIRHVGGDYALSPVLFIPDTTPCDFPQSYKTNGTEESLFIVSFLYDVCVDRIQAANPNLDLKLNTPLEAGLTLSIPETYPCYHIVRTGMYPPWHYETIPYACYREPIDFNKDYTGTEPPMSLEPDAISNYCYEVGQKPILYENQFYEPIWATSPSIDGLYDIAACYDVDFEAFVGLNELDTIKRIKTDSSIFIPIPHEACDEDRWRALYAQLGRFDENSVYMVKPGDTIMSIGLSYGYQPSMIAAKNNLEAPYTIYPYQNLQMPEHIYIGHLNDQGIYTVNYDDTLSSIARRFGYLPSMIAAENNLESPYWIYPYQELQMPRMPSLYDIGKAVLYVGGVGAGMIGFGLYRMRRRGKKKQKPAA